MEIINDEYCIVRTLHAGVFAGNFDMSKPGKEGFVYDSRRIWYWAGAASLSQLAMEGTKKPEDCRFPCEVPETYLTDIAEIIPCTKKAEESIKGVEVWRA